MVSFDRVIAIVGVLAAIWALGPARCDTLLDAVRDADVEIADDGRAIPKLRETQAAAESELQRLATLAKNNNDAQAFSADVLHGEDMVGKLFMALSAVGHNKDIPALDPVWLEAVRRSGIDLAAPIPGLSRITTAYYERAVIFTAREILTSPNEADHLLKDIGKALLPKQEFQMKMGGRGMIPGEAFASKLKALESEQLTILADAKAEISQREKNTEKFKLKKESIRIPFYCAWIPKL